MSTGGQTSHEHVDQYKALKELCASDQKKTSRPELRQAGMTDDQIDRLLAKHAKHEYDSVHIGICQVK